MRTSFSWTGVVYFGSKKATDTTGLLRVGPYEVQGQVLYRPRLPVWKWQLRIYINGVEVRQHKMLHLDPKSARKAFAKWYSEYERRVL